MASNQALPTISELLDAFAVGAQSKHENADVHRGAIYDVGAGMGALVWSRVAARDREVFRGIYLDGCQKDALDYRIARLHGPGRIQPTRGSGVAIVKYDYLHGGAGSQTGTILKGTRLSVSIGSTCNYYRVASDVELSDWFWDNSIQVDANGFVWLRLPIEADSIGSGVAIDTTSTIAAIRWEDELYNLTTSLWVVDSIKCSDGTDGETDVEYLARYRSWKKSRKPGYSDAISRAMFAAGASKVALFESDFVDGEDFGINRIFVGDSGYTASTALLNACRLALDSVVPFGNTTTVGSMILTPIEVTVQLNMMRAASRYSPDWVLPSAQKAVRRALSGSQSAYVFRQDSLRAELSQAFPELQSIDFASPTPGDTDVASIVSAGNSLIVYDCDNVRVNTTIAGAS